MNSGDAAKNGRRSKSDVGEGAAAAPAGAAVEAAAAPLLISLNLTAPAAEVWGGE